MENELKLGNLTLIEVYSFEDLKNRSKTFFKKNNKIVGLNLSNLDLIELPTEIANYKNLKYFYCQNNQLSGFVKKKVQTVNLKPFFELVYLEELDCSHNQITSLSDLSHCTKLKILNCSHNQIVYFPTHSRLEELDCSYNFINHYKDQLSGQLFTEWFEEDDKGEPIRKGLKKFDCSYNLIEQQDFNQLRTKCANLEYSQNFRLIPQSSQAEIEESEGLLIRKQKKS